MGVDFVDIWVVTEPRRQVDRLQNVGDDLVGSGRFGGMIMLSPNGKPRVIGRTSDRNRDRPSRLANQVPRVKNSWLSCPPMETAGTIGTPASIADLTYPVRPLKSTTLQARVGRYAS